MTDIIPAGDSGSFIVTKKMLTETGAVTLEAFEVLITHEARARGLDIHSSHDLASNATVISWRLAANPSQEGN